MSVCLSFFFSSVCLIFGSQVLPGMYPISFISFRFFSVVQWYDLTVYQPVSGFLFWSLGALNRLVINTGFWSVRIYLKTLTAAKSSATISKCGFLYFKVLKQNDSGQVTHTSAPGLYLYTLIYTVVMYCNCKPNSFSSKWDICSQFKASLCHDIIHSG